MDFKSNIDVCNLQTPHQQPYFQETLISEISITLQKSRMNYLQFQARTGCSEHTYRHLLHSSNNNIERIYLTRTQILNLAFGFELPKKKIHQWLELAGFISSDSSEAFIKEQQIILLYETKHINSSDAICFTNNLVEQDALCYYRAVFQEINNFIDSNNVKRKDFIDDACWLRYFWDTLRIESKKNTTTLNFRKTHKTRINRTQIIAAGISLGVDKELAEEWIYLSGCALCSASPILQLEQAIFDDFYENQLTRKQALALLRNLRLL